MEFSEHRPYTTGDDFRYLDWAAYGRLDRLLLRLFQQDEDLAITLMVDVSASMLAGGAAGGPKADYARRLTAALSYIGLSNLDRIRLTAFAEGEVAALRTRRGRGQIFSALDFLAGLRVGGRTDLRRTADQLGQHLSERGLVVVISDFLAQGGELPVADFEDGLGRLRFQGHEVWAILVESPEEIHPPESGEIELVDAETGQVAQLRVTPEAVAGYLARREKFLQRFDHWTMKQGIAHLRARTDMPVDELVLDVMRRGGFLK